LISAQEIPFKLIECAAYTKKLILCDWSVKGFTAGKSLANYGLYVSCSGTCYIELIEFPPKKWTPG
jgi:hypothetical protein